MDVYILKSLLFLPAPFFLTCNWYNPLSLAPPCA